MKVAVTARGSALSSELDPRFGRASHFVLVDAESGEYSARANTQNARAAHGAGTKAAQDVVGLGAKAVITGDIGPKAAAVLQAADVVVYRQTWGTVRDAIEHFRSGRLKSLEPPSDTPTSGPES
jgi:predicted Fe-Mo cluster-binding NifX family protein